MKEYSLSELSFLRVLGRTTKSRNPLVVFWTAGGIECSVSGQEFWLYVEVDYETYEPWISVLINGAPVSRQLLLKGKYWICIYRGMNPEEIRTVRIVRDVQAMSGDASNSLCFYGIRTDGEFYPLKEKPVKIEFIGDSITSGEGLIGAKQEESWISMWFGAVNSYTAMTAELLDADYRVISQSGWGVLSSWDNNPHFVLSAGYEKVCGVLTGSQNEKLGAFQENDFTAWQPDIVVINLGTNDGGAFYSKEWRDTTTGESFRQHLESDGSFRTSDLERFEKAVVSFLGQLRRCNPKAHLLWAYGMLGTSMLPSIRRAAALYQTESGDQNISVIVLPEMTEEGTGARQHPGLLCHRQAADTIFHAVKSYLKV